MSAPYFMAGIAAHFGAAAIVVSPRTAGRVSQLALAPCALMVLLAVVSPSHSVSRMEDRLALAALTAAHQLGASVWIGGMPFLLVSLKRVADADEAKRLLRRFSPVALVGAGTLLAGGVGMAWFYLGVS